MIDPLTFRALLEKVKGKRPVGQLRDAGKTNIYLFIYLFV